MALEHESKFFEDNKAEWLKIYKGQFALIEKEVLWGTFTTHAKAYEQGIEKLGNVQFLIKRIEEREEVIYYPALSIGAINASS